MQNEKKKILLIRPKNVYNYNNYPSLGLISIASVLKANDFQPVIINSFLCGDIEKTIRENIKDCLFVGLTLLTSECQDAHKILNIIKQISDIPVIIGGWHCTLFSQQMIESNLVDYVVEGDGEEYILQFARSLLKNEKSKELIFEKKNINLENLPLPDYSIDENIEKFINNYLTDRMFSIIKKPIRWLPYESSRGCPSKCTFCINIVANNTAYRKKSAEKVIFEITEIVKKYNITHLKIVDDNFFVDIKRVRLICEGIIKNNLNITWDAECRCDYFNDRLLNDETLILAKKSGLVQLTLGIESGSQHTLNLMQKEMTCENAEYAVQQCDKHQIIARTSFIIEIPGETKSDIQKTNTFINKLRRYSYFLCAVQTFRPYPKCVLTQKLVENGILNMPQQFSDWLSKDIIDLYVAAQCNRPWKIYKNSESVAFYQTMESGTYLGYHMMDTLLLKIIHKSFSLFAKIRNRLCIYILPIDKFLYKKFMVWFFKRRNKLCQK